MRSEAAIVLCAILGSTMTWAAFSPARMADEWFASTATPSATNPKRATELGGLQYRLPETLTPIDYEMVLNLDTPVEDAYEGELLVKTVATREVDFITFHVDHSKLTVTEVSFKALTLPTNMTLTENQEFQTTTVRWEGQIETSSKQRNHFLIPGEEYSLVIKFTGKLRTDMYGFYRSTYMDNAGKEVRLAATQFEATYARSAFPCWDEPHYKATFTVSITYPTAVNMIALSNTPGTTNVDPSDSTRTTTKFERTPPMSTYLVAFVVCDYEFAVPTDETPVNSTTSPITPFEYRVYVRQGYKDQGEYAANVGIQSLRKMEGITGIKYEEMGLGKLHLIAIPDFSAGAMENWGLITFRETGLMFTEGESTEASKENTALLIAHEQAHMWFGDLVSPAWWGYVWLNEGFARYMQFVSMHEVNPSWRLMDTFVVRTLQGALAFDSLVSSHPMSATVYTATEIQTVFDRISYDKGASVLHMTRHVLGDDNFKGALNKYLSEMKKWTAKPTDLFRWFDEYAKSAVPALPEGLTLTKVLATWTEQKGYPVVTIRSLDDKTAAITQARFTSTASNGTSDELRWWVPVSYALQGDVKSVQKLWLDPSEASTTILKAKDSWIVANIQQTGFYRVNYEDANWAALSKDLQDEGEGGLDAKVPVLNRAQLLDDALSLARAGLVQYPVALEMTRFLKLEKDPIPWTAALGHLDFLEKMLVGDRAHEDFKKNMLDLLNAVYEDIGFGEKPAESIDPDTNHLRLTFRASLMGRACELGLPDCISNATAKFADFKTGTSVEPSLRSTVYCTGIRESQRDWDWLWSKYLNSTTSPGEKILILGALGCSQDSDTLNKYLKYSLDNTKVRPQDSMSVFSAVLGGGDNLDLAFTFFKDNFKQMNDKYIQKVVAELADKILTEEKLQELEDFLAGADIGVEPQAAAARSLETARTNLAWRSQHLQTVSQWVSSAAGVNAQSFGILVFLFVISRTAMMVVA